MGISNDIMSSAGHKVSISIMDPTSREVPMSIDMSSDTSSCMVEEHMSSAKKRKLSLDFDFKNCEETYSLNATSQVSKAFQHVPSLTNWLQPDTKKFKHEAFIASFQQSTSNEQTTAISKLFYCTLRSSAKCSSCQHETVEEMPLKQLTLNTNEVNTIEEAVENYFASQRLTDADHKCPSCERNVPATKQLSLQQHPIILKASDGINGNISKHIETFPEIDDESDEQISFISSLDENPYTVFFELLSPEHDLDGMLIDGYSSVIFLQDPLRQKVKRYDQVSSGMDTSNLNDECLHKIFKNCIQTGRPSEGKTSTNPHPINFGNHLLHKKVCNFEEPRMITMHIFNLNDECLYKIFKNCTLTDLCSVAETSTKFRIVANEIFARKYKICRLDEKFMKKFVRGGKIIPRMLMNFGAQISEFWIYAMPPSVLGMCIMNTMIRYCSGTVEKLKLIECKRDYTRSILRNTFPNLKHFVWQCNDNAYQLDGFLSSHRNLETLTISCCDDYVSLLLTIAKNCKQLVELDVEATDKSKKQLEISNDVKEKAIKSFVTLQKLKKLRIYFPGKNVTEFVQVFKDLKNLNSLEIVGAHADRYFVPYISQLEQLHVLRLVDCSELEYLGYLNDLIQLKSLSIRVKKNEEVALDVVQLIKSLINLETLYIGLDTFKMDKTTYYQIVDVVRGRPNGRNSIEIECAIEDTDVYFLQSRNNVKLNWWSM